MEEDHHRLILEQQHVLFLEQKENKKDTKEEKCEGDHKEYRGSVWGWRFRVLQDSPKGRKIGPDVGTLL